MVRMMPILVLMYAIQCFLTVSMELFGPVSNFIFSLGGCLVFMVAGFYFYNLKHKVDCYEDHLEIHFFGSKTLMYQDIFMVEVDGNEDDHFATLIITCKDLRQVKFYLIDDAFKMKDWLQAKRKGEPFRMAA